MLFGSPLGKRSSQKLPSQLAKQMRNKNCFARLCCCLWSYPQLGTKWGNDETLILLKGIIITFTSFAVVSVFGILGKFVLCEFGLDELEQHFHWISKVYISGAPICTILHYRLGFGYDPIQAIIGLFISFVLCTIIIICHTLFNWLKTYEKKKIEQDQAIYLEVWKETTNAYSKPVRTELPIPADSQNVFLKKNEIKELTALNLQPSQEENNRVGNTAPLHYYSNAKEFVSEHIVTTTSQPQPSTHKEYNESVNSDFIDGVNLMDSNLVQYVDEKFFEALTRQNIKKD